MFVLDPANDEGRVRGVILTPTLHFEAIDQSHRAIEEARADKLVVEIVNGTADCRNREQRECDDEYGRPGDCVSKALHAVFPIGHVR